MIEVFATILIVIDLVVVFMVIDQYVVGWSFRWYTFAAAHLVYLFIEFLRIIDWLMAHVEVHL